MKKEFINYKVYYYYKLSKFKSFKYFLWGFYKILPILKNLLLKTELTENAKWKFLISQLAQMSSHVSLPH